MSITKYVNFCYRNVRVNQHLLLRSRMQPFWLLKNGELRCTGYAKDAVALVERTCDANRLLIHGYSRVIQLPRDVEVHPDEYRITVNETEIQGM